MKLAITLFVAATLGAPLGETTNSDGSVGSISGTGPSAHSSTDSSQPAQTSAEHNYGTLNGHPIVNGIYNARPNVKGADEGVLKGNHYVDINQGDEHESFYNGTYWEGKDHPHPHLDPYEEYQYDREHENGKTNNTKTDDDKSSDGRVNDVQSHDGDGGDEDGDDVSSTIRLHSYYNGTDMDSRDHHNYKGLPGTQDGNNTTADSTDNDAKDNDGEIDGDWGPISPVLIGQPPHGMRGKLENMEGNQTAGM